ncbi:hypothetical protein E2562_032934 [Oryza meyeriana var. granulata]|uniref:Uncharacterized protein n=1 Tax=Oryza meyeriana var. granulata TaxID=110450 RepID=A0A6G1DS75_9ORYZ|nr:hypothetical protein E2562_032934 [Oryza meyeriana var. granulata]
MRAQAWMAVETSSPHAGRCSVAPVNTERDDQIRRRLAVLDQAAGQRAGSPSVAIWSSRLPSASSASWTSLFGSGSRQCLDLPASSGSFLPLLSRGDLQAAVMAFPSSYMVAATVGARRRVVEAARERSVAG